jgi:DNA repair ATPase RecN
MGLLAATVSKQYLIAYKNDLEYKISLINQSKLSLSQSATELIGAENDLDPDSPMVKQLEQRRSRLNQLEKKLDMELNEYQEQLAMINNNMKTCDGMIKGSLGGGEG